jgi:predicted RNA-binding protein YlqC (UPF0109 family)
MLFRKRADSTGFDTRLRALTKAIVVELVDDPDAVQIDTTLGSGIVVVEVSTGREGAGQIIGKNGRNAEAIRTLLRGVAAKHRLHCDFNVIAPLRRD